MASLESRLQALEQHIGQQLSLCIVVRFCAVGGLGAPLQRIEREGQEWTRSAGETDDALIARARLDAAPGNGALVLFAS